MLDLFSPLLTSAQFLLVFFVVLSILVAVHEFGHYLVAKWCGVRIETFSIGFGKEMVGMTDRTGTRWKLSLIPLGGYVKMFGEMDPTIKQEIYEDRLQRHEAAVARAEAAGKTPPKPPQPPRLVAKEEEHQSFFHKPLYQRALIVLAGPVANLLLAALVYASLFYMFGKTTTPPIVGDVVPESPAAEAGLVAGDRILALNGDVIETFQDFVQTIAMNTGTPVDIRFQRGDEIRQVTATPEVVLMNSQTHEPIQLNPDGTPANAGEHASSYALGRLGVVSMRAIIAEVMAGSPAEAAGLQAGDIVREIDDEPVHSFNDVVSLISPRAGKMIELVVERDGALLSFDLVPETLYLDADGRVLDTDAAGLPLDAEAAAAGQVIGRIGVRNDPPAFERTEFSLPAALWEGVVRTGEQCERYVLGLWQIVSGARSTREMGGPIRIAQMSNQQAERGIVNLVLFMAALSIGLAIINLLPIPVLDGGHLFMYAFEAVRGRPMSHKAMDYAFRFGAFVLLSLMVFVFVNDIKALFA